MNQSKLYRDWYEQVILPPENDYVICISASSKTPVSGTGKTTLGTGLAKALDRSPGGFDAETQATLSAEKFANEIIPQVPSKAAVVMDESQGTPGGGSGMNRMRAMSQSTMDAIGSVLANRDKNLTIIVIVQRFGMLFSDFFPLVDSWLLISKAPGQVGGPECKHHKVHVEDYPDAGGGLRTPIIELLDWPAIDKSDPDYRWMEKKKQAAKTKGGSDDGEEDAEPDELSDQEQLRRAKLIKETTGVAWVNLPDADKDGYLTYSGEWYRQRLTEKIDDSKEEASAQ